MELSDIEWGDVVSDADGVLVVEGRVGDDDVVVRRYADPEAPMLQAVRLLAERGERADDVLAFGDDWICFAACDPFDALFDA